jgi:predicted dithiol-disulfide oxidoreductase (DUF899 family)
LPSTARSSQLFEDGKDTLIIYSYMYGPQMKRPCVMCTSILDGEAPHVMQRVNLAVIAKSPIERILQFTRGRGWRNLPLLSSANNTYNHDYHALHRMAARSLRSTYSFVATTPSITSTTRSCSTLHRIPDRTAGTSI